ncbi:hypothetical protein [Pseudomonas glycinae]|uniref:hypothetical protein n=1 Tax=Pseudomonas glycinae TaxID=1785145 RepID=UPI001F404ECB|nr:hypothetical protein [Pseudomonas glycinae]
MSQNLNRPSKGTFNASLNGVKFLTSTLVKFHESNKGDIIQGYDNKNNFIVFFVELLAGGPHKVMFDKNAPVAWTVQIGNQIFPIESGHVIVTFDQDHESVTGTVNLVLQDDEGTVTGDFNITNLV